MNILNHFIISFALIFLFFSITWIIANSINKARIVDIAWGIGFVLVSLATFILNTDRNIYTLLTTIFVTIWGLRLAIYIFIRSYKKPEDFRYQNLKEKWGKTFWTKSLIFIFYTQAVLLLIISSPIIFINSRTAVPENFYLLILGCLIWLLGFLFESISDLQMFLFKRDQSNKGKILTKGLWRFTRHPNYFGETLVWWGIYVIALSFDFGFIFIISPILITFLLLKVSGVTLLEKKYKDNKEYLEYIKKTSAFFPKIPKK